MTMKTAIFATLILWFLTDFSIQAQVTAMELNAEGVEFFRQKQYKEALQSFSKAIGRDPTNADFYYNRADAYYRLQSFRKAVHDLNKAVDLSPSDPTVFMKRGWVKYHAGNYKAALEDYEQAIFLGAEKADSYNERGLVKSALKQYKSATADFTRSLAAGQVHASVYTNRAEARYMMQDYEGAMRDYTTAFEQKPDGHSARVYDFRGLTFLELKMPDKAIEDFSKAIELEPKSGTFYYNYAYAQKEKGNMETACEYWQKAHKLGYSHATDYLIEYCNYTDEKLKSLQTYKTYTYIDDRANVLTLEERDRLEKNLAVCSREAGHKIKAVIIKSLEGKTFEEYTVKLMNEGLKHDANDILILISEEDGKAHIEVDYNLEGILTDWVIRQILSKQTDFQKGQYSEGLNRAIDNVMDIMSRHIEDEKMSVIGELNHKKESSRSILHQFTGLEALSVAFIFILSVIIFAGVWFVLKKTERSSSLTLPANRRMTENNFRGGGISGSW